MKTYTIFIKEDKKHSIDDVLLVKEGFNFFAMFFNIFWFLYQKLWLFAGISFIIVEIVFSIFSGYFSFIFYVLFSIFVGFDANNLLLYRFQKEKYTFAGYSMGNDEDDAKIRFLEEINKENKKENKIIY